MKEEFDTMLKEVKKALPPKHPVVDKLEEFFIVLEAEEEPVVPLGTSNLLAVLKEEPPRLEELMYLIGDWMRGTRDWPEVEGVVRRLEQSAGEQGRYLPSP